MLFLFCIFCNSSKVKLYHGQDCSTVAKIVRDKTSENAVLKLNASLDFTLYAGDTIESIDYSHPFTSGTGPIEQTLPNTKNLRKYFQLVTNEGKCILSEKHPLLEKGFNFRELGGIRTKDGRHVKWGKFFRSDQIFNYSDSDLKYLDSISLQTVVDFRTNTEVEEKPDINISRKYFHLGIDTSNSTSIPLENFTSETGYYFMRDVYHDYFTKPEHFGQYREFFKLVQNPDSFPLLFHCSAGKDRTGTAAFLILSSLGVSRDVIFEDYMLTNEYYLPSKNVSPGDIMYYAYAASEDFLNSAINTINENYGSIEKFLTGTLNVDLNRMKELYLD